MTSDLRLAAYSRLQLTLRADLSLTPDLVNSSDWLRAEEPVTIVLTGLVNPPFKGTIDETDIFATTQTSGGAIVERSPLPASTLIIDGLEVYLDLGGAGSAGHSGNISVAFAPLASRCPTPTFHLIALVASSSFCTANTTMPPAPPP